MSAVDCRQVRLAIGGEPRQLPEEVQLHVVGCSACRKFRDETLAMERRLQAALELPLHRFRAPTVPVRRYALAASLLLALLVGGGAWLFRPQPALAQEVIEHLVREPGSWEHQQERPPWQLAAVLEQAGVSFDAGMPVVYAAPCSFRGRTVPHLVVQTSRGPMTVMLLPHVRTASRETFREDGYEGELLPAGSGSIALIMRGAAVPQAAATQVLSSVRWR